MTSAKAETGIPPYMFLAIFFCLRNDRSTLSSNCILFRNDVKHGMQNDTRNLIGSAIMKVDFKH